MGLRDEMFEQPQAAQRLLDSVAEFKTLAAEVQARRPSYVVIAARGSSDNAALYAQYLFGVRNSLVTALATPSTLTLYGAHPRMAGALVIGISQSGRSPDIVAVLDEGREQGAVTVAITNDPDSPLAEAAAHVIDLRAGPELATAATKTYTTELLAVAMLSHALDRPTDEERSELARVPELMSSALESEEAARVLAHRHAERDRCIVLGRGYGYATAREWALKLQELAQVSAFPFSSADFEHGPLALAEPELPVLVVAPGGASLDAQLALLTRLKEEHGARILTLSADHSAQLLDDSLPVPSGMSPWLSPIVEILPAQLYTYYLTRARGLNPESPRTIQKVTRTT
jgi:glucosamine--fructose-6-phosphate aminotransferase (isomerizing)